MKNKKSQSCDMATAFLLTFTCACFALLGGAKLAVNVIQEKAVKAKVGFYSPINKEFHFIDVNEQCEVLKQLRVDNITMQK